MNSWIRDWDRPLVVEGLVGQEMERRWLFCLDYFLTFPEVQLLQSLDSEALMGPIPA